MPKSSLDARLCVWAGGSNDALRSILRNGLPEAIRPAAGARQCLRISRPAWKDTTHDSETRKTNPNRLTHRLLAMGQGQKGGRQSGPDM